MNINMKVNRTATYGTCFQGVVHTDYAELVRIFGPGTPQDGAKTNIEWRGTVDGEVFTIYDWKEGNVEYEDIHEWHIGGNNEEVARKINDRVHSPILFE